MALGKSVPEVMGLSSAQRVPIVPGMAEDAAPYDPEPGSILAQAVRRRENAFAYIVKTSTLDNCGVEPGDILLVDIGADAVEDIKALDLVVAQVYPADASVMTATTVIRQFIPPGLLITNSRRTNETPLIRDQEAVIKGVVTDIHRRMRG